MIHDDEELAVEQNQLGRVERALESLRAEVYPKNPRNFEIYSDGYAEQIAILKAEIDAYLAQKKTKLSDPNITPTTPEQPPAKTS